ncbi:hypothetical protein BH11ARM2_BH11ARM2_33310 [soil metagenome]
MKRILLLTPLLLIASCAKFPDNDTSSRFARISFTIQMQGEINDTSDDTPLTNYLYYVAIRTITTEDVPNTGAPVPVIDSNTPNGFVAGSPTHFVLFDSQRPTQSYPYRLFKFNPGPVETDPDNPINLGSFFDTASTRGPIVNFVRPTDSANKNELKFDIFLNQLANTDEDATQIKKLQINVLTMNQLATQGVNTRAFDALGNSQSPSEINTTITIDLRSNNIVTNNQGIEPTGDVINGNDPSLDIQNYTVEVHQP